MFLKKINQLKIKKMELSEQTLIYIFIGVVCLIPLSLICLYLIITKEYKDEIKKAKKNLKKINN